jgi:DMSO reductase family type II enzyme heme b subunit
MARWRRSGPDVAVLTVPTSLMALMAVLLVAVVGAPGTALAGDAAAGKVLYDELCSSCHGDEGAADVAWADRMLPRPRAFLDSGVYKVRSTPSGELPLGSDLLRSITNGLHGTAMPGWARLTEPERSDLVALLETTTEDFADPAYVSARVAMPELASPLPEIDPALLERGAEVYVEADCRKCHGDSGRGNGPSWADQVDDRGLPAMPADLTHPERFRAGSRHADVFRTLSTGLDGSAMASFADTVSVADRQALAAYVLSLDEGHEPAQLVVASWRERFDPMSPRAWDEVPVAALPMAPQLVRAPRLLWGSVHRVLVQAVHTDDALHLRVRWVDRERSTGDQLVGDYPDFDTTVHADRPHPDRVAVQFQPGPPGPGRLPPFLLGDAVRPVDAWTATSIAPIPVEVEARGGAALASKEASTVVGGLGWRDGLWTLVVSRSKTTTRSRRDVQFVDGVYAPIGVSVWNGSRGEVGIRRSTSSWYALYLAPPPSRIAGLLPVGRAGIVLLAMIAIGALVRRRAGRAASRTQDP